MLEILQTPITVLHIVVALFVVLIVLLQPGKSGGIGAALGGAGAQQVFGGRGAGNFLSRLTWISAGIFFATSMMLAYVSSSTDDSLAKHSNTAVVKPVELPEGDEGAAAGQPQAPEEEAAMEDTAGEAAGGSPATGEELAAPEAADADEKGSEAEGTDDGTPAEVKAKPADEKAAPEAPKADPPAVKPQAAPQKPAAPKATPTTPAAPAKPGPAVPPALPPASPAPPPAPAPAAPPGTAP